MLLEKKMRQSNPQVRHATKCEHSEVRVNLFSGVLVEPARLSSEEIRILKKSSAILAVAISGVVASLAFGV
jgi:hypothetical protein